MNKLLYSLLISLILFSACSSEDDKGNRLQEVIDTTEAPDESSTAF